MLARTLKRELFCKVSCLQSYSLVCPLHLSLTRNEGKFHIIKLIAKLDSQNQLISLEKNDIKIYNSAGGTKGGQKANRSKSLVRIVHEPTKVTVTADDCRNVLDNQRLALARLHKAVDLHVKGEESVFRKMEEENRLKNIEIRAEKARVAEEKKERVERLKQLLNEEDTLKY